MSLHAERSSRYRKQGGGWDDNVQEQTKNCNREKLLNNNYDFQLSKQVAVQAVMTPMQQDDNFSLMFHLVKINSISFFLKVIKNNLTITLAFSQTPSAHTSTT